MKKLFGLIGLFALLTSITGRYPKTTDLTSDGSNLSEARTASVVIISAPSGHSPGSKLSAARAPVAPDSISSRAPCDSRAHSGLTPSPNGLAAGAGEPCSSTDAVPLSFQQPLWLNELNRWRRMAGLALVTELPLLSHGSQQHARYLVMQAPGDVAGFRIYDRRMGPAAHIEAPHTRSYTLAGAEAAIGGPLAPDVIQGANVAWEGRSESDDIDELMLAPFHRLSLLAPWAHLGGYGSFGVYPRRAAALALRGPLETQGRLQAIEFPPANMTVSLNVMTGSEWPNPAAGCFDYERPIGLPITLQTGHPLALQSFSIRDNTAAEMLAVCGFDAATYVNADPTQQTRGRELLGAYGAAVLIPRNPLVFGHQYHVRIHTSQGAFEWNFATSRAIIETASSDRGIVPK